MAIITGIHAPVRVFGLAANSHALAEFVLIALLILTKGVSWCEVKKTFSIGGTLLCNYAQKLVSLRKGLEICQFA